MQLQYPRWQYANQDGQLVKRLIQGPAQEDPDVWKESPQDVAIARSEGQSTAGPHGGFPCKEADEKFDAAWKEITQANADLRTLLREWEEEIQRLADDNQRLAAEKLALAALVPALPSSEAAQGQALEITGNTFAGENTAAGPGAAEQNKRKNRR